jgi:5'(3')-deoxyribonucleotidase
LKLTKIFLDLDDVLNDFTMHTLRSLGCYIDEYDPEWGWDIVRAANSFHPLRHFTPESFWSSFDREHWATIPKSPMCDWLIERSVTLVGCENVCVLTCPTPDPDCTAGKQEWIYRNLPNWLHSQFLIGPPKHLCASPGALLIDDRDKNVEDFRMAGGRAILVPKPWNRGATWSEYPLKTIQLSLRAMGFMG